MSFSLNLSDPLAANPDSLLRRFVTSLLRCFVISCFRRVHVHEESRYRAGTLRYRFARPDAAAAFREGDAKAARSPRVTQAARASRHGSHEGKRAARRCPLRATVYAAAHGDSPSG